METRGPLSGTTIMRVPPGVASSRMGVVCAILALSACSSSLDPLPDPVSLGEFMGTFTIREVNIFSPYREERTFTCDGSLQVFARDADRVDGVFEARGPVCGVQAGTFVGTLGAAGDLSGDFKTDGAGPDEFFPAGGCVLVSPDAFLDGTLAPDRVQLNGVFVTDCPQPPGLVIRTRWEVMFVGVQ